MLATALPGKTIGAPGVRRLNPIYPNLSTSLIQLVRLIFCLRQSNPDCPQSDNIHVTDLSGIGVPRGFGQRETTANTLPTIKALTDSHDDVRPLCRQQHKPSSFPGYPSKLLPLVQPRAGRP